MKKIKSLGLSLAVISTLGFVGCGGGSSSAPTDDIKTGTFVDSPVQGLNYSTATQSGVTNSSGEFEYKNGESVTFKLGTLELGESNGNDIVTPYNLDNSNLDNPGIKAKNIAMLLQNLDQNRSKANSIIISSALKDYNFSAINLNTMSEADVNTILSNTSNYIDKTNNSLITQETALTKMKSFVTNYRYTGTYSGSTTLSTGSSKCTGSTFTIATNGNYIIGKVLNGGDINGTVINGNISGSTTNHETFSAIINSNGNISSFSYCNSKSAFLISNGNTGTKAHSLATSHYPSNSSKINIEK